LPDILGEEMSRRAKFINILSNILDFQRNRTGKSILLFLFGVVSLGWLTNALYGLVALLGRYLFFRIGWIKLENPGQAFLGLLSDLLFPILCFLLAIVMMWRNYRHNTAPFKLNQQVPAPHPGLIMMLSPYFHRNQSALASVGEVEDSMDDPARLRAELLKSNWGPLIVAVEHHSPTLQHCWIIVTKGGSLAQFEVAEKVVRQLAGKKVKCHEVELEESHNIGPIVERISHLYREAPAAFNLERDQVIADITGGTAAMSGAMILATIEEDLKIEYLRQDKSLVEEGRALFQQEIKERELLLMIDTSPVFVPMLASKSEVSTT
jgi:hypothetical protein